MARRRGVGYASLWKLTIGGSFPSSLSCRRIKVMFIFHVKRNSEQDLYYWSVDEKREKCCSCVARTRSLLAISSFIEQLLKRYMCGFSLSSGYSGFFLVLQRIHMLIDKVDLLAGRWNLESCPPMPVLITLFLWSRASLREENLPLLEFLDGIVSVWFAHVAISSLFIFLLLVFWCSLYTSFVQGVPQLEPFFTYICSSEQGGQAKQEQGWFPFKKNKFSVCSLALFPFFL